MAASKPQPLAPKPPPTPLAHHPRPSLAQIPDSLVSPIDGAIACMSSNTTGSRLACATVRGPVLVANMLYARVRGPPARPGPAPRLP